MPSERSSDVEFEIGHVLFVDIVRYSKLLITEQSERLQTLKEVVRGTQQCRLAEAQGKLLRLPTGDSSPLALATRCNFAVVYAIQCRIRTAATADSNSFSSGKSGSVLSFNHSNRCMRNGKKNEPLY